MRKIILVVIIVLLGTFAKAQTPAPVKLFCDKSQSTITYAMNHPLHSWTGVSKEVTSVILTDEKHELVKQVAVSVKIASFDSQNANRDSHTMEVTEALKYPNVTFSSTSIVPKEEGKYVVTGMLTFHGVSHSVTFEAEKKVSNNKMEVTGNFVVKMSQYNIDPPSLIGVKTDDDMKMSFDVVF